MVSRAFKLTWLISYYGLYMQRVQQTPELFRPGDTGTVYLECLCIMSILMGALTLLQLEFHLEKMIFQ